MCHSRSADQPARRARVRLGGVALVGALLAAPVLIAAPAGAWVSPGGGPVPAAFNRGYATTSTTLTDPATAELPGGGRVMFPGRRLVALYGHPGAPSLGVLGEQGVDDAVRRARRVARPYRALSQDPVVPAFEIIATVAQRSPGGDGNYSIQSKVAKLRPWVRAAGRAGMLVLLDLQPGRADLTDQARRYRSLLKEPHVGLAVDPEWKLGPGQLPLRQIGRIGAGEINRTSAWLARLTRRNDLPQKLFVVHQFKLSMIGNEDRLRTDRPEVAILIHMDGQGGAAQKHATWDAVRRARPAGVPLGWKNFYDEDTPTFTPEQTMRKRPRPRMISYQ